MQGAMLIWALGAPFETYGVYQAFRTLHRVDPMELCHDCRHSRRTLMDTMGQLQSVYPFLAWLMIIVIIAMWPGRIVWQRMKWIRRGFKQKHSCFRNFRQGKVNIREGAKEE